MGQSQDTQRAPKEKVVTKEEEERNRLVNKDSQKLIDLTQFAESFVASLSKEEKGVILTRKGLKRIPAPLYLLTHVTLLDLSFNRIQLIPQELGALEQLIHLNISHNHIQYISEKDYPETEVTVITRFRRLQFLDISWNNIPTVRFIKDLAPSITHLDIHHNPQITVVPDLSHLYVLSYFNVSECFIRQLPNLESLPLKTVYASYNLGLKQLPRLPASLTFLDVAEKIESIGIDFGNCINLNTLSMRNNFLKSQEEFNGAGLHKLTSLTNLALGPSQMKEFPDVVCRVPSLTSLEYGGMKNLTALPDLFSALTNLQRLVLRWNEISTFPTILLSLSRLTFLDVSGNGLTEVPPEISQLSELQHLNLTYNKLQHIPRELGQITTLQSLYVDENPIEDPQLLTLAKIGNQKNILTYIRTGEIRQEPEALLAPSEYTIPPSYKRTPPSPKLAVPQGASKLSKEQLIDKIRGTIFGAAVGDAVGLATEFLNKEQSSFIYGRTPITFSNDAFPRDRHRGRWLTGDWTDDTDQFILIMENLIDGQGDLDVKAFGLSLIKWAYAGFSELGDDGGMGIGQTVGKVLNNKSFLDDPHAAALQEWEQSGRQVAPNGAVMRTGILGIPNFDNLDKVVQNTLAICQVTHADPRCLASCVAVTTAIALMLQGEDVDDITRRAEGNALKFLNDEGHISEFKHHMHAHVSDLDLSDRPKIGYTFKSLGSGFYGLRETDFEKTIMKITWEAGDADTNATVAGAMLGCKLGLSRLPPRWVNGLVHKDWLHRKVNTLLEMMDLL